MAVIPDMPSSARTDFTEEDVYRSICESAGATPVGDGNRGRKSHVVGVSESLRMSREDQCERSFVTPSAARLQWDEVCEEPAAEAPHRVEMREAGRWWPLETPCCWSDALVLASMHANHLGEDRVRVVPVDA